MTDAFVRIKEHIHPYSGKRMYIDGIERWPNGRIVLTLSAVGGPWFRDYTLNEVDVLNAKAQILINATTEFEE